MKRKNVYLLLCFLGIGLPYSQVVPWLLQSGLNLPLFWQQLMANRVSAFFAADVLVSAISLLAFIRAERPRGFQRWLPIVAVLTVGVSLGLPLFLYFREIGKEAGQPAAKPIAA
ncbi:MAG TPA: DUF2834 domain-containing protein [Candidatus Angelobacter sp.]|nr:DUF2834 domain-containing protein [Candidatus Angelobacter sp.]